MATDPDCIFCKIVAGDIPSQTVFSNDDLIAFLDIGPLAEGHLLVVPRDHFAGLVDMTEEAAAAVAKTIPMLGRALLQVTGAEGFNLLVNNGKAAGQEVLHVHWHLIPRVSGDGLGYRWNAGSYAEGRLEQLADAFRGVNSKHESR